ncbi:MAG: hypothetical protein K0V04_09750 [Deltaproteobacteria bacterium]|nr:hypothetical protein [Deltaproteobacteria bacterium]
MSAPLAHASSVVLPQGDSAAIALTEGFVTATAEPRGVRVQFADDAPSVLLFVDEAVELHHGDMISAGAQWLLFESGEHGGPSRLHQLDEQGVATMTFTLRGSSLTMGRTAGDVLIPRDELLSSLHFQLLMREGTTYLQDLASEDGTYLLVRSGELVPLDCQLLIGERPLRIRTSPPMPQLGDAADYETSVTSLAA